MRPLTSTLTPAEVAELLDLSPSAVDALLDTGRILCRFKGGQAQVPLAQLESFFRDALLRVYAAEVRSTTEPASIAPPLTNRPEAAPVAHEEPRVDEYASDEPALPAIPPESPASSLDEAALASQQPAMGSVSEPRELPDQRRATRYVPLRQIDGIFGDTKFTILQLSASGLRIRHRDPLLPGGEAKITFSLIRPARSVVFRARVVWTSLARSGDERFSISGLRVIEHGERLERAIDSLNATHDLQPERRVRNRRNDDALATMLAGASDEEIALVTAAVQKFAEDPVEANRWYSRARFALSDEHIRRVAPPKPRDRDEVLGIWEYLDRQVDVEKVAGVLAWTRAAN